MGTDCIFCKIVSGEIPSTTVFQDDQVVAFEDVNPQAPTHILIIPRDHLATLNELDEERQGLAGTWNPCERHSRP